MVHRRGVCRTGATAQLVSRYLGTGQKSLDGRNLSSEFFETGFGPVARQFLQLIGRQRIRQMNLHPVTLS
jgi:hypothetical protein